MTQSMFGYKWHSFGSSLEYLFPVLKNLIIALIIIQRNFQKKCVIGGMTNDKVMVIW